MLSEIHSCLSPFQKPLFCFLLFYSFSCFQDSCQGPALPAAMSLVGETTNGGGVREQGELSGKGHCRCSYTHIEQWKKWNRTHSSEVTKLLVTKEKRHKQTQQKCLVQLKYQDSPTIIPHLADQQQIHQISKYLGENVEMQDKVLDTCYIFAAWRQFSDKRSVYILVTKGCSFTQWFTMLLVAYRKGLDNS